MPVNLELKAHYPSRDAHRIARTLKARFRGEIFQVDTYFYVREGRLKLREARRVGGELVSYRRGNSKNSRYSDYTVFPVERPAALRRFLAEAIGTRAIVRKKRSLYLYRNARIHVDRVDNLGSFIEFEVIVRRGKSQARKLMRFLRKTFDVQDRAVVAGSYADLLQARTSRAP